MKTEIHLSHTMVVVGTNGLAFDLIEIYNGMNINFQRLLRYAYGFFMDDNSILHVDDEFLPVILHIVKCVPSTYKHDDTFDEETLDNVCTLIDYVEAERAKR